MAIHVSKVFKLIIVQFLLYENSYYISEDLRSNVCWFKRNKVTDTVVEIFIIR